MGVWERVPLRSHSLSFPFLLHTDGVASVHLPPPPLCAICRTAENHPIQGEGLAVAGEKMLVGLKTLSGGGIR